MQIKTILWSVASLTAIISCGDNNKNKEQNNSDSSPGSNIIPEGYFKSEAKNTKEVGQQMITSYGNISENSKRSFQTVLSREGNNNLSLTANFAMENEGEEEGFGMFTNNTSSCQDILESIEKQLQENKQEMNKSIEFIKKIENKKKNIASREKETFRFRLNGEEMNEYFNEETPENPREGQPEGGDIFGDDIDPKEMNEDGEKTEPNDLGMPDISKGNIDIFGGANSDISYIAMESSADSIASVEGKQHKLKLYNGMNLNEVKNQIAILSSMSFGSEKMENKIMITGGNKPSMIVNLSVNNQRFNLQQSSSIELTEKNKLFMGESINFAMISPEGQKQETKMKVTANLVDTPMGCQPENFKCEGNMCNMLQMNFWNSGDGKMPDGK